MGVNTLNKNLLKCSHSNVKNAKNDDLDLALLEFIDRVLTILERAITFHTVISFFKDYLI